MPILESWQWQVWQRQHKQIYAYLCTADAAAEQFKHGGNAFISNLLYTKDGCLAPAPCVCPCRIVPCSMRVGLQKAITVLDYFEGPSTALVVSDTKQRWHLLLCSPAAG